MNSEEVKSKIDELLSKFVDFWQAHPNLNHGYVMATAEDYPRRLVYLLGFSSPMSNSAIAILLNAEELLEEANYLP